jgi:hypothetical protein
MDFYLDDERAQERQQIIALVQQNTADADNTLVGYIREGMRELDMKGAHFRAELEL